MPKPAEILTTMIMAACLAWTSNAFAGDGPNTNLPYTDGFEEYPENTPLDTGTNGWYGSCSNILVQTNTFYSGTKAALIPVDCTLSNRFQSMTATNVWIQMDVRPTLYDGMNPPLVDTNVAWMFYINSNGNFVVHNGAATDPSNSLNWVESTNGCISTNGTNWVGLQVRVDYLNHTWALYAESTLVTNEIGFINSSLVAFSGFEVYNGSSSTYLDNVSVILPAGMEVVPLSLTNCVLQGYNATSQVFEIENNGGQDFDYAVTVTTGSSWLAVQPTAGTCTSAAIVTVTNTYTTDTLTNALYYGQVRVVAWDGWGFVQTNLVNVELQVMARPVLAIMPQPPLLAQSFSKGGNPTNQTFSIWNASSAPVVPMIYTNTISNGSPALIQSLSAIVGTSTGQVNSVTINYQNLSGLETGVYTASVHIDACDAGTTYWPPPGSVHLSTTLVVQVSITSIDAPSGVTASDGTYTDKVRVTWNPVADAVKYKIYRTLTFDSSLEIEPIGEAVITQFDDVSGVAGVKYYYWVSAVNVYMSEGPKSTDRESGYRALAAPAGIFATDGIYTNKVRVTWPLVDGATGYQLYRRLNAGTLAPLYFTTGGEYDDVTVASGVHYTYYVAATNGMFGSALSVGDAGYSFGVPANLNASDGTYVGKVRLTWSAVESASGYEVWRGTKSVLAPGTTTIKIASVLTPAYDDSNVEPGVMYYYWVRGESLVLNGTFGGWSQTDRGYEATAGVDLRVNDLVVLPVQIGAGSSPAVVSFRMGNAGGTNLSGVNGTVSIELFASKSPTFGAAPLISMGKIVKQLSLATGHDLVEKVSVNQLMAPVAEGDYYIFVQVLPQYPSLLADINPDNNVARRNGIVRVRLSGGLNYHAFNDYDGDGMSDLAVYRGGVWSIRSLDNRVLISNFKVFDNDGIPVLGDLDGDKYSDPMAFDSASGMWQVYFSGSVYMWASGFFGSGGGYRGLVADYEGLGHGDASVFHEGNGRWFVLKADSSLIEWNWGSTGYQPVIGDYDGDGRWDLAVYQESTGLWYIRTLNDPLLISNAVFGGPGLLPVPGDYDGDGCWDAAVYHQANGTWYIISLDGRILAWNLDFGIVGSEPVMGDYDGDGKWDLALYQESTGLWYIMSLDGRILAWASHWGGDGYHPIGN